MRYTNDNSRNGKEYCGFCGDEINGSHVCLINNNNNSNWPTIMNPAPVTYEYNPDRKYWTTFYETDTGLLIACRNDGTVWRWKKKEKKWEEIEAFQCPQ